MNRMTLLQVFTVATIASLPLATLAQIKTDASLGRPANTLSGPDYVIPQSLGKLVGGNLFHSFQTFNINSGESAAFTTASAGINNVVSRVTGGSASLINGRLSLLAASGTPNFYFINPAGVTFGAGASIDVPGAFHVATANYLKFPDGNFYADTTSTSTFSSVDPVAFGFLGTGRASIIVKDGAVLSTQPLQPISVIGGDIAIIDSSIFTSNGGDIRVLALGKKLQEVRLTDPLPTAEGSLSIINSFVWSDTISKTSAGSVKVAAGSMIIDNAVIYSEASGNAGDSGGVEVAVDGHLAIQNGGEIASITTSSGKAGSVHVNTGSLLIDGRGSNYITGIYSEASSGAGDAGNVNVAAKDQMLIKNGGRISSNTFSAGKAGSVKVSAGSLVIDGSGSNSTTRIVSNASPGSTGDAGSVDVAVSSHLTIQNGGRISSNTFSSGNAGSVKVSAGSLMIDGSGSEFATGIFSDTNRGSTGNAGSLNVAVKDHLTIQSGGQIFSSTSSAGKAGSVKVSADSLTLDGSGSELFSGIFSFALTGSSGDAGSLTVAVKDHLAIQSGGRIFSGTFSSGNAGLVKISAGSLMIDGSGSEYATGIDSLSNPESTGDAGNVEVMVAGHLAIQSGGHISSNRFSSGNAGSVKVSAGSLTINGSESMYATGIISDANPGSTGDAGSVDVAVVGQINIENGGRISSGTLSSGNAGTVKVSAGSLMINGGESLSATGISSDARYESSGNAGSVNVTVADHLSIQNGGGISSVTYSSGKAGSVKVSSGSLMIDGNGIETGIVSDANSDSTGDAGSVDVAVAKQINIQSGGRISSITKSSGNAGSVRVSAGSLAIDGSGSNFTTGIVSNAETGSTGDAGSVDVAVADQLIIQNGGQISSNTFSAGKAGSVKVSAGLLTINGSGSEFTTGIVSEADLGSTGDAGSVDVAVAKQINIQSGGLISSDTFSAGKAGSVKVSAASMAIDGSGSEFTTGIVSNADTGSTGDAGSVDVAVTNQINIQNGGRISSDTFSVGKAGSVKVSAGSLTIDGSGSEFATGIFSDANSGSTGGGGSVDVAVVDQLIIQNGGQVSSSTLSAGKAGLVKVSAGSLTINGSGSEFTTGIVSNADTGSTGDAGSVDVAVAKQINIQSGGRISSDTFSAGKAGSVKVSAGSLTIDGSGSEFKTGIFSDTNSGSTGGSGSVDVAVADQLIIQNGGQISSNTFSAGKAGSVKVSAGSLAIDGSGSEFATGIFSDANPGSAGDAGSLDVAVAGQLTLQSDGRISSITKSSGNAGSVKVSAGSLTIDGSGSKSATGIGSDADLGSTGDAGSLDVAVANQLSIQSWGKISSSTFSAGNAGSVKVSAGSLTVDGSGSNSTTGIVSEANSGSTGDAGSVNVTVAGQLAVKNDSQISSASYSSGKNGVVKISAGSMMIDNAGISSNAYGGNGDAGGIEVVVADQLVLQNGGLITSSANASRNAGFVSVRSGSLSIQGSESLWSRIGSDAMFGSSGDAGSVYIETIGSLSMQSGTITSNTYSQGNAGSVSVVAGSINIYGGLLGYASIASDAHPGSAGDAGNVQVITAGHLALQNGGMISSTTLSYGNAGNLEVRAGSLSINGAGNGLTGIFSQGSIGKGGNLDVAVSGNLDMRNKGEISASTGGAGNAGSVKVKAESITLDGMGDGKTGIYNEAGPRSTGHAGQVRVEALGQLSLLNGAVISSSTFSSGNAGSVKVVADSLKIDGYGSNNNFTGVSSDSVTGSGRGGDAGYVDVAVKGHLALLNGGEISSSTSSPGKGGFVNVQAASIDINGRHIIGQPSGIYATADEGSSGQTGNVLVSASDSIKLGEGGVISISNFAMVSDPGKLSPTELSVTAPRIALNNGEITASSTGNVSASNISLNFTDRLSLEKGSITTSANIGHGGSIHIRGGNLLNLDRSQITTSVLGLIGNGGDIHIDSQALVMNTGFIQANTAAASAIGGDVQVNVNTLLPSGNTLFVGGQTPYRFMPDVFGFNVIQAAAPTGVSGAINVTAPVLDMSGSLNGLSAKVIDSGKLGRNPCQTTGGSSLAVAGRGGSAESARSWLGTELTLDTILADGTEANTTPSKIAMKELGCRHL